MHPLGFITRIIASAGFDATARSRSAIQSIAASAESLQREDKWIARTMTPMQPTNLPPRSVTLLYSEPIPGMIPMHAQDKHACHSISGKAIITMPLLCLRAHWGLMCPPYGAPIDCSTLAHTCITILHLGSEPLSQLFTSPTSLQNEVSEQQLPGGAAVPPHPLDPQRGLPVHRPRPAHKVRHPGQSLNT